MMSSVIQTCQNNLSLNLCVMPPTGYMVIILENGLVRRGVKYITKSDNTIKHSLHQGESLQSWLRYIHSVKTLYSELSDVDLSEQPWPQLMYYTSYKLCGYNFRR